MCPYTVNLGQMLAIGGVCQNRILSKGGCKNLGFIVNCHRAARVYGSDDTVCVKSSLQWLFCGHVEQGIHCITGLINDLTLGRNECWSFFLRIAMIR